MGGTDGSAAGASTAPYGQAVVYEEKLPRRWMIATAMVLAIWVAYQASILLPQDSTVWFVILGFSTILALIFNAVPISKRIYNRIHIRDGRLTVGRETIPVESLTVDSLREAREQPTDAEFVASLTSRSREELAELRRRSRETRPPRIMGGGWSVPMGMDQIVVQTAQGESLLIATHHREALVDALMRARQR
ncbi:MULTISPECIES: hypothetical protein [Streptomyces]|uniref:Uncharacterized protein n=1 Tax=Streptomyces chartreusis NRRL 3882 TaxID=1079985 RepID=A0A2N9B969_STRCX|nr:hypothetical protein [Streptomyces chartreusis]MYS95002.1 hypothetical protein [Streptomyces sp. SID5464]SOR79895.1 hypothetical protein SCNRRL3882_3354 [Streptomyces chartreusis NRRL 3882]